MSKTIRNIGVGILVVLWVALAVFAWFGPCKELSVAERRPLAQMPAISLKNVLSGQYMTSFEDYSLDQFPLRDSFRQLKALFHYHVLRQGDNNGIYVAEGFAAKQEYPLEKASVKHALERFQNIYNSYLKESGSTVVMTVVPDKSFYLAKKNGNLAMDYDALFSMMKEGIPWADYVDLTDCLAAEDYYRTDTHWRQEKILPAAEKLCRALGASSFSQDELMQSAIERPFYGVYYGQAALPMQPETIYTMENPVISSCRVTRFGSERTSAVYDLDKLDSRDLYDVFLSGAEAVLTVENPNAESDRELIVFRDSFGSSITPLLLKSYKTVTVVDIRYIRSDYLPQAMDFHGQDVLFLYSTLVLNSSSTLG